MGSVLDDVESNSFKLPTRYSHCVLASNELHVLRQLYSKLSNDQQSVVIVNSIIFIHYINGRQFRSGKKPTSQWLHSLHGMRICLDIHPHLFQIVLYQLQILIREYSLFHESVFYCQYDNFICVCMCLMASSPP